MTLTENEFLLILGFGCIGLSIVTLWIRDAFDWIVTRQPRPAGEKPLANIRRLLGLNWRSVESCPHPEDSLFRGMDMHGELDYYERCADCGLKFPDRQCEA